MIHFHSKVSTKSKMCIPFNQTYYITSTNVYMYLNGDVIEAYFSVYIRMESRGSKEPLSLTLVYVHIEQMTLSVILDIVEILCCSKQKRG